MKAATYSVQPSKAITVTFDIFDFALKLNPVTKGSLSNWSLVKNQLKQGNFPNFMHALNFITVSLL